MTKQLIVTVINYLWLICILFGHEAVAQGISVAVSSGTVWYPGSKQCQFSVTSNLANEKLSFYLELTSDSSYKVYLQGGYSSTTPYTAKPFTLELTWEIKPGAYYLKATNGVNTGSSASAFQVSKPTVTFTWSNNVIVPGTTNSVSFALTPGYSMQSSNDFELYLKNNLYNTISSRLANDVDIAAGFKSVYIPIVYSTASYYIELTNGNLSWTSSYFSIYQSRDITNLAVSGLAWIGRTVDITWTASSFLTGEMIVLALYTQADVQIQQIATVKANDLRYQFTLPSSISPGMYTIKAFYETGGPAMASVATLYVDNARSFSIINGIPTTSVSSGTNLNIQLSSSGFAATDNLQVKFCLSTGTSCVSESFIGASSVTYMLVIPSGTAAGSYRLRFYYNGNLLVESAVFSVTTPSSSGGGTSSGGTSGTSSSGATTAIIGAAVGGGGVLLIGAITFFVRRASRKRKQIKSYKVDRDFAATTGTNHHHSTILSPPIIVAPDSSEPQLFGTVQSPQLLPVSRRGSQVFHDQQQPGSRRGSQIFNQDSAVVVVSSSFPVQAATVRADSNIVGYGDPSHRRSISNASPGFKPVMYSPPTSPESTRPYYPVNDEDLTNETFATLQPGSIILGRFKLKGVALSGGTASVRLATDEKTDKKVAIKLTNAYKEAVNELKVLKAIRSPYVVSLEDTYEVPQLSAPLIVMEHLDKSLSDFVRSKQLDTPAIKMIFSQIVAGVEHIHSANFVHCDLKPQNIMLCSADVQWKIIDFGNTKQALTDDINGLTPMYCPPEVARAVLANRPIKAHPSVDMWQLGVILYYMYTRSLPYDDIEEEKDIFIKLVGPDFAPELNGIGDNQAKNLLSKLFVDDPKKRLALDKLKRSAYLNSGLDTMQVETAASANAGVLAEKLSTKLDAISDDVKQVKDLSRQALGQIVAARRQVFEHQEYKCPRLVLMLPKNSKQVSAWNPKKWFTDSFLLFLLCEHDDCVHFTDHPGYELTEPKDFVRKAAPILSKTLMIANAAVSMAAGGAASIPPSIFMFLNSASKSSALSFLTNKDEETKARQAAEYLEQVHGLLAPVVEEQIEAGADVSKLIGSSLREMQMLLHEMDPKSNWGGLQAVSTPDGQVRYVCPEHAKQYYIHQA